MQRRKTSSYSAALFDLDGTLIEFKFKVKESRQAIIDLLRRKGFDVAGLTTNTLTQDIMNTVQEEMKSPQFSSKYSYADLRQEVSRLLDEFETEAFSVAKPHPGSLSVLRTIHENGMKVGLVTNSGRVPVDVALRRLGFLQYLALVITRDEAEKLKPCPDGINQALQKLNVRPTDSVYVGDSVIDIQAAKAAGVCCVAVASGLHRAETLLEKAPDYLINKIEELEGILFPNGK